MSEIIGDRRALINIGYRMLGSLAEAEDAVQETYARWYAMTRQVVPALARQQGRVGSSVPGTKLLLFDDAGHGFLFQDAATFARDAETFLS